MTLTSHLMLALSLLKNVCLFVQHYCVNNNNKNFIVALQFGTFKFNIDKFQLIVHSRLSITPTFEIQQGKNYTLKHFYRRNKNNAFKIKEGRFSK